MFRQQGWSYFELMVATVIMSIGCIALIQLQQRFFQQVQRDHQVMLAFMQRESQHQESQGVR